jgi:membrane protein YdbS with pleckstrin-like domain
MTPSEQPAEPGLEDDAPDPVGSASPDTEGASSIADGIERSLDPRSVTLARVGGWIVAGAISLGSLVPLVPMFLLAPLPGWVKALIALLWVAVALVLAWSAHRWPAIEHRHASYTVDGRGIEIRRGVVWRRVINVPRSRVQHTDVSQGPLERRFGLGTLVIYTAGTDHAKVDLHGLDHATALRIRDHLVHGDGEGDAV